MRNAVILCAVLAFGGSSVSAQPAASPAQPAAAPAAAPALVVGSTVFDPAGAPVGTIDSITAGSVIVSTGSHKVAIPPTSFGTGPKGPLLSVTRAEVDTAAAKAEADAKVRLTASLKPGAEVHGVSGQNVVGSVKSLDGDSVVIATPAGDVKLPLSSLTMGPSGIIIGMSAAEFEAAVAASKPAA